MTAGGPSSQALERRLATVLYGALVAGILLLLGGALLALLRLGTLPEETTPLTALPGALGGGEPAAVLTAAVLLLLAGPPLGLLLLLGSFLRARRWRDAAMTAALLGIISGSVAVAAASRGG